MASVDVGGLHGDQILHQLASGVHTLLEEGNDNGVELFLQLGVAAEQLLVQQLAEDADQLIVNQRDTLVAGVFQALDLLLDDQLESSGSNEKGRGRTGGVVENSANINVLDLVEGIHGLDTVGVELVEHETDTSTTRQLNAGQLLVITLQNRAVLVAELGDDVENNVGAVAEHGIAELRQLRSVLLKGGGNAALNIGESLLDVHHEDLHKSGGSC